ncbi:short chain dehydrogenase domain-containing protein [Sarocladium implicatum]|nr:short chain dehydrogenase domain-containing protein [Sarocladium implicatum]
MWGEAIKEQWATLPVLLTKGDAAGKTYIVTGANGGLGFETAKHLVRASASRVILAVRNLEAGKKAQTQIERDTGRSGVTHVWQLDLSSFGSVKAFAAKANKELDRLDVLVCNAGVSLEHFDLTEGVELSLKVNVLSTFLLAMSLFPKLIETGKAHESGPKLVVVLSALGLTAQSGLHRFKNGDILASLNDPKQADMKARYAVTKLIEIYAIRQLAAEHPVDKTGVTVNMVDPGICRTNLARDTSSGTRATVATLRFIMGRSAEEGSRTILHAIVAEEHGKFLSNTKVKEHWIQPWMVNEEGRMVQKKVWEELSAKLLELDPNCFPSETFGSL